ncbi:hypothetical protein STEG23_014673, partial [Scotinomys teguina]
MLEITFEVLLEDVNWKMILFSETLLEQLLSSVYLWEEETSTPMAMKKMISGHCHLTHENRFDWAGIIPEEINCLSLENSKEEFVPMICHTFFSLYSEYKKENAEEAARSLLLLLLMCGIVASVPRCIMKDGGCKKVLSYMFNMTSITSESINLLSADTLREFDAQYDPRQKFQNKPTMTCHTASVSIPNSKRQAQGMQPVALLNVTIRILAAWKNLLYPVANHMADLNGTPNAITSKVAVIDGQIKRLTKNLQDIKSILSQVIVFLSLSQFLFWTAITRGVAVEFARTSTVLRRL